jgi:hypothetical protein
VKKLIIGAGAVGAAAVSIALFGLGVAAANDYAGQTYADAVQAIEDAGDTAVVVSRVGGRLPQDDCIVTSSSVASFVRPMTDDVYFETVGSAVRLSLKCAGGYVTATKPGASIASPAGREAKAAADESAAAEEQELAEVSTPGE